VRALALPGEDCSSLEGLEIEIMEGNILNEASLEPVFAGVEIVYHLAALVSIEEGKEDLLYRVNVEGTKNVIRAARRAGVRRLVYTSSIHAIERPPDGVWISEELPFDIHNPAGPYDRTKAEASLAVLQAVKEGLDAVIVCPTGVVGPYDYRRSEMGEMFLSWMRRQVSFIIEGCFDFVDVRDVARGHILAAEKGRPGQVTSWAVRGSRSTGCGAWCRTRPDAAPLPSKSRSRGAVSVPHYHPVYRLAPPPAAPDALFD